MLVNIIQTEGHDLEAVIDVQGCRLRVCDGVSSPEGPLAPGSLVDVDFGWLGLEDASWEEVFRRNRERRIGLEPLGGWSYSAYGRVVSVDPVRVDLGIIEIAGPVHSHDARLIGEYVAWQVDRLDMNGL